MSLIPKLRGMGLDASQILGIIEAIDQDEVADPIDVLKETEQKLGKHRRRIRSKI